MIDYIVAGDVFQVNLGQRLFTPPAAAPGPLFAAPPANPAPLAAYFDLGDFQVVSASPERFLQVRQDRV